MLVVTLTQRLLLATGLLSVAAQSILRASAGVSERQPAWSPDGASLAYIRITPVTERQFRYQLVLASVTTGRDTVIVDSTKQAVLHPDWRRAPAL